MSITSTPKLRELALGAKLLRSQPQFIDHTELANLVADWIEAEVLMWDTAEKIVELTNVVAADISGGRAGRVEFGKDADGNPAISIDTSVHAHRIIDALTREDDE